MASIFVESCQARTTPVADVTPDILVACATAQADLALLVGEEPSLDNASAARDSLGVIVTEVPDVKTEIGSPSVLVGNKAENLQRDLSAIIYATRKGDGEFNPVESEQGFREDFASLNKAAAMFGKATCLESEILQAVLIPQITLVAAEVFAPTGDFDVDIDTVCNRFRERQALLILDDASDLSADRLVWTRLRGLGAGVLSDLEQLDPPTERKADFDSLVATLEELDDALVAAGDARLQSQEEYDDATEKVEEVDAQFAERLETLNPGC